MTAIVKMQRKGQVTIPSRLRIRVGLADGDLVEAREHRGKIILTPKLVVDREYTPAQRRVIDARLDQARGQVKRGETFGPFGTHEEMISFLHEQANKARPNAGKSVKAKTR
jgi:AbrB family looped-hinge helix DNA binding protein